MSAGLSGLLALQGVWLASPPVVVSVDVPVQVLGGKGPLLRPDYDLMADLRTGDAGASIRLIRDINESLERTTRQERELVGV